MLKTLDLEPEYAESYEGRPVKVHSLTQKGRETLARERESWRW